MNTLNRILNFLRAKIWFGGGGGFEEGQQIIKGKNHYGQKSLKKLEAKITSQYLRGHKSLK